MRLALLSYNISKHEPLAAFWWLSICHTVHIPNARLCQGVSRCVRRACAEAKLEQLQELCNNLHLQFAKQLDIQEECNNTIATYACPGCGFINLSKTLLPPIGNGLGCGCCYDCPVDVEVNYAGN